MYRGFVVSRTKIYGTADALRLIGPGEIYSEGYYKKRQEEPLRSDARRVSNALLNYFEPSSVIDFGCAIGSHLELFHEEGIKTKGIEGNRAAFNHAVIPREYLEEHDLRDPYEPEYSYDIALCFEVAEHLPERFADRLVDTLVAASNTIVMTAAPPGQVGRHHVNNQPREYWCQKFNSRGMEYDSEAVAWLRKNIEVEEATWIGENMMVFRGRG